jgi:hypothetical protein
VIRVGVVKGEAEPFLVTSGVKPAACGPERATVMQPASPTLDNHVGVRHASALHAAGYAAARALAAAAVATVDADAELSLQSSEISYKSMGLGALETIAEPAGDDWGAKIEQLRRGDPVALRCAVTTRNEQGRNVAELTVDWLAAPRG